MELRKLSPSVCSEWLLVKKISSKNWTVPEWELSQAFAVRTTDSSAWIVNFGTAPDGAGDSPRFTAILLKPSAILRMFFFVRGLFVALLVSRFPLVDFFPSLY